MPQGLLCPQRTPGQAGDNVGSVVAPLPRGCQYREIGHTHGAIAVQIAVIGRGSFKSANIIRQSFGRIAVAVTGKKRQGLDTEVYAELDQQKAMEAIVRVG